MENQSIHTLYRVKRLIHKWAPLNLQQTMIEQVNTVLLAEAGPEAVLYPYNSQTECILALFHEGLNPDTISSKTGVDRDIIEDIVGDPGNYLRTQSQLARI